MLVALAKLSKNVGKEFKKCFLALLILIPVGCFNLFGFVDTAFELGIMKEEYTKVSYDEEDYKEAGVSYPVADQNVSDSSEIVSISGTDDSSDVSENASPIKDTKKSKGALIAEGVFNGVFIFGSLCFHYFFYQAMIPLCEKTDVLKKKVKAKRNSIINILFFSLWGILTAGGASVAALTSVTLAHFVIIILNFIYIYGCYATFAYQSDVEENDED